MQQGHHEANRSATATDKADAPASEFLTFRLGDESYGIEILKVQEIRGYETPTALANAPEFIKGGDQPARGHRSHPGSAHQVPDAPGQLHEFRVVIILNVTGRVVGVVVDIVSDVLTLAAGTIRPTPEFSSATFDTRYITGLGSVDDRMLILLDIEKLMTGADMALVEAAVH